MKLFRSPNPEEMQARIEKMQAKRDAKGLIDALTYDAPDSYDTRRVRTLAEDTLVQMKAVEPLITALRDKRSEVRFRSAEALGRIHDPRAVQPLCLALRDPEVFVREAAANALDLLGDSRAVEPLIAVLGDQAGLIRQAAAKVLGGLGDARAVEPLAAAANEWEPEERAGAALALGRLGDPRAVQPLIDALQDRNLGTRADAAEILARIGDGRAAEPLLRLASDTQVPTGWSVRSVEAAAAAARTALDKLLVHPRAAEWLVAALGNESGDVRASAATRLRAMGPAAVESLIGALNGPRPQNYEVYELLVNIGASRAVEPLITKLKDPDAYDRRNAAWALGRRRDAPAVEPLIAVLQDPDASVRNRAAEALGEIRDARAVEPLISLLPSRDEAVRRSVIVGLGKIADARAVEPLITAIQARTSSEELDDIAEALGKLGDTRAVEPLLAANASDSEAALAALSSLGWQPQPTPLPQPQQGSMEELVTQSPEAAVGALFDRALPLLQVSGLASVERDYQGFERAWESHGLIQDRVDNLRRRVLTNLTWSAGESGFHSFHIALYDQNHRAEVVTFADSKGASVCFWRTEDKLYLCGNAYFT